MKSITRLVTAVVAVMFAIAILCPAQDVYDSSGAEVAKDDSPGPKCSVKVAPEKDGQYKFVIKNAGGGVARSDRERAS